MGRALYVSRSLPPIISSARSITSIEKPNCITSSIEIALKGSSHGERNYSCPNMGCVPLSAKQAALGPNSTARVSFRAYQNRLGGVLARWFSSETDFSESEWLETDDEHGAGSQSTSHHLAAGCKKVLRSRQEAFDTKGETGAATVGSTLPRMGIDDDGHMQHRRQKSHDRKEETDDDYKRQETDDRNSHGSQSYGGSNRSHHRAVGRNSNGSQSYGRGKISHHLAAGRKQVQGGRQAAFETESETDAETVANALHGIAIDSDGRWHMQHRRQKSDHVKEENGSESGSSMSDWHETDHDTDVEAQAQGSSESEVEVAGSGLSDWVETDVDEQVQQQWQEIYESGGDNDDANASSSSLSRSRDLSHLKTSASFRPRAATVPERPSKKERSAGLSPRLLRDDDSDDVEIESDLEGELQDEIERQMAAQPKFERPSITYGILLTKDLRQLAREKVLKYLETEGIDTTELKRIELPTTVEVMQTRLGFLRKIGLDDDTINNHPLVLGCSVQKNMVPVLKYLKKIGFPQHWVPIVLKKYPMILYSSVIIDVLPVIYFLRGLDIDAVDLPRVITKYPDVLGFKTEGTMSTSVAYLVSMGVNMRYVGYMLTEYPEILGMRVASVIKPKFEYLMSLGIPQMIVAKILESRPYVLGYHLENRMQFNVNQLLEVGVRKEAIPGMVAQFPELLGRVFAHLVNDHVSWFKQHLELDSDGVARMIEKMPQVIFMRTAMALERIMFLKSERFTVAEIGSMATQCPQILVSSIHQSLRPNLTFLTKEMKRSRAEVLDFPAFFTYSLHARLIPRFKSLSDRNVHCSLDWVLNCSDLEFRKRLKAGFGGDERVGHVFVMGGLLPGKPGIDDDDEFQSVEHGKVAAL